MQEKKTSKFGRLNRKSSICDVTAPNASKVMEETENVMTNKNPPLVTKQRSRGTSGTKSAKPGRVNVKNLRLAQRDGHERNLINISPDCRVEY